VPLDKTTLSANGDPLWRSIFMKFVPFSVGAVAKVSVPNVEVVPGAKVPEEKIATEPLPLMVPVPVSALLMSNAPLFVKRIPLESARFVCRFSVRVEPLAMVVTALDPKANVPAPLMICSADPLNMFVRLKFSVAPLETVMLPFWLYWFIPKLKVP